MNGIPYVHPGSRISDRRGVTTCICRKLKPTRLPFAIMFVASKDCFRGVGYQGCQATIIYVARLALPPALGGLLWMQLVWRDTFLWCSIKWYLQRGFDAKRPSHFFSKTPLFPSSQKYHQPTLLNNSPATIVQVAKSGRCLKIPSMITTTTPIIRTLLMCGIIPLPKIGLHS